MSDDDGVLLATGFEAAYMGVCRRFNTYAALYDYAKCLTVLMERDGMTYEDAEDYMAFNVLGAYVGEQTPVFLVTPQEDEDE